MITYFRPVCNLLQEKCCNFGGDKTIRPTDILTNDGKRFIIAVNFIYDCDVVYMNRNGLKEASKQCIRDSSCHPYAATLIYFLIVWVINAVVSAVSSGTIFDAAFVEKAMDMDLMDMFEAGVLGAMTGRTVLVQVVNILGYLILAVLGAGFTNFCLRLSRGTAKGFSDISAAMSYTGKLIWLTILINVYVFLWTLLFVIPGIIASYRYSMAYFALMNDPDLTASQALEVSKQITSGHKMELFVLDLSFFGWHLLCSLTFGILYIWKLPYIETTKAHAFNWLMSLRYPPVNDTYDDSGYQGPEIL